MAVNWLVSNILGLKGTTLKKVRVLLRPPAFKTVKLTNDDDFQVSYVYLALKHNKHRKDNGHCFLPSMY